MRIQNRKDQTNAVSWLSWKTRGLSRPIVGTCVMRSLLRGQVVAHTRGQIAIFRGQVVAHVRDQVATLLHIKTAP